MYISVYIYLILFLLIYLPHFVSISLFISFCYFSISFCLPSSVYLISYLCLHLILLSNSYCSYLSTSLHICLFSSFYYLLSHSACIHLSTSLHVYLSIHLILLANHFIVCIHRPILLHIYPYIYHVFGHQYFIYASLNKDNKCLFYNFR